MKSCALICLKSIIFQEKCPSFYILPQVTFCNIGRVIHQFLQDITSSFTNMLLGNFMRSPVQKAHLLSLDMSNGLVENSISFRKKTKTKNQKKPFTSSNTIYSQLFFQFLWSSIWNVTAGLLRALVFIALQYFILFCTILTHLKSNLFSSVSECLNWKMITCFAEVHSCQ